MRYVLYDKASGAILHSHQSFKLGSDDPQEMTDDEMRAVVGRFADTSVLDIAKTEVPVQSSRQAKMTVDLKTREVIIEALASDALGRRLGELRGKPAKKKED